MADNFNLRQFLTENKLTKNAQLLKEGSDYGYEAVIDAIADHFDEGSYEYDQVLAAVEDAFHSNEIDTSDFSHDPSAPGKVVLDIAREKVGLGPYEMDEEKHEKVEKVDENIDVIAQLIDMFPFLTNSTAQMLLGAFGAAGLTGFAAIAAKVQQMALKGNFGEKAKAFAQKLEKAGGAAAKARNVSEVETIHETLTDKERRLVEMVQTALKEDDNVDYTMGRHDDPNQLPNPAPELNIPEGDDNVDYTMGRHDDPNQLPNPAPELNIPEGDEMVDENPLPKYKNIDELMSNIEHGTNEAAHKYKMERMKKVAEALEAKVTSLEEGENAEHIDQKAVKQMRKDILALRKAEEKLRKEFDKKFAAKKEKKEDK